MFFHLSNRISKSSVRSGKKALRRTYRPQFEGLEDRRVLAQAFSWGVHEGKSSGQIDLASFSFGDAGEFKPSDFKGTVVWGDGTQSSGKDVKIRHEKNNNFIVSSQHTFNYEGPVGGAKVFVEVPADNGRPARRIEVARGNFLVTPAPLDVKVKAIEVIKGVPFNGLVATFKDLDRQGPEKTDHYKATIFWGDGKRTENARIERVANGFRVYGSHTYTEARTRTLTVLVKNFKSEKTDKAWSDASSYLSKKQASATIRVNQPNSVTLKGGVLKVDGNDLANDVSVGLSGNRVRVVMTTLVNGKPTTTVHQFPKGQVSRIVFHGNGGNDRFESTVPNVRTELHGGPSDDTMIGGPAADKIYGDLGNDTLYGRGGPDTLHGGAGLDGLYGGLDKDQLYGGADADRFLVPFGNGQNEFQDAAAEDAIISLKNGDKNWAESEVEQLDQGLRTLHHKTKNDNLLEPPNQGKVTLVRNQTGDKPRELASNNLEGTITFYDAAFDSPARAAMTAAHEMAHNWENLPFAIAGLPNVTPEVRQLAKNWGDGHSQWHDWLDLSGWSYAGSETWQHDANAKFARDYGNKDPSEDWATAWESYFAHRHGLPNAEGVVPLPDGKLQHLDKFFDWLTDATR